MTLLGAGADMATQQDIARHLGITQPAVAALVRDGIIAAAARGGYDLDAARLAYCANLREQAAGRAGQPGATHDLATERARLAAAQAELVERRNARERGDAISAAEVDEAITGLVMLVTSRLALVGARVAGSDYKLRKRIDTTVTDALEDLSKTSLEFVGAANVGEDIKWTYDEEVRE